MYKLAILPVLVLLVTSPLSASENDFSLSGTVTGATEYVVRGLGQTDGNPALQIGVDLNHESGFYLGTWGSNVDFNEASHIDGASIELDLFGGYAGEIGKLTYDVSILYYAYPGSDSSLNYGFGEAGAVIGYDWGAIQSSVELTYSPDFFGGSGNALYAELAATIPLSEKFSIQGHWGRQIVEDNATLGLPDHNNWRVGVGWQITERLLTSAFYADTNIDKIVCSSGCNEHVLLKMDLSF